MKVKYKSGDIFAIPLKNGKYTICQVLWAPKADYKKVFSFCVLENGNSFPVREENKNSPININDNGKNIKVIFTGVKKIVNGEWEIIAHENLSEDSKGLMFFNIAGFLHEGDNYIRKLSIDECSSYPAMSVFGFDLIQDILIDNI